VRGEKSGGGRKRHRDAVEPNWLSHKKKEIVKQNRPVTWCGTIVDCLIFDNDTRQETKKKECKMRKVTRSN